jgi:Sulfate permease and related transporters (MFS superfamily)
MGVTILLFMLVGNQFIESVPTAALIGIMIVVAFKTFEWGFFRMYKKCLPVMS